MKPRGKGIRQWIEANPSQQEALFAQNPRFIFFQQIKGKGPLGGIWGAVNR